MYICLFRVLKSSQQRFNDWGWVSIGFMANLRPRVLWNYHQIISNQRCIRIYIYYIYT